MLAALDLALLAIVLLCSTQLLLPTKKNDSDILS
jgi:hypothetical protein